MAPWKTHFDIGTRVSGQSRNRSRSRPQRDHPTTLHALNTVRLHSAIGYVTPQDMLTGRQAEIHAARDRELEQARGQRQLRRQQAMPSLFAQSRSAATMTSPGETEAGAAGTQPC
jgi:hypothetical protein